MVNLFQVEENVASIFLIRCDILLFCCTFNLYV
jgi:hypothetical protein